MAKPDATKVIAVCGKGGVGKTSVSAMIAKILSSDRKARILAIDADPAVGLASALGLEAEKTVNDIRNNLIERIEKNRGGDKREIVSTLDYEVFEALEERDNIALLAIGRPEDEGCYCQVNDFLKEIIRSVAWNFDYVVIDGEAGIEQINRRVMDSVTHLLLVSDASRKGINVAGTIMDVAEKTISFERAGLVLNRIMDNAETAIIDARPGLEILGLVPEDEAIRKFDIEGKSILDIPGCPALSAVQVIVEGFAG